MIQGKSKQSRTGIRDVCGSVLREPLIEEVNEPRAVLPRASSQEGSNSSFSGEDFPFSFSSLFSLRGLELMAALTGCHFGAFSLL